ncbi:MAG: nucleoside monophosphate kinase [Candidatus Liptonbacteria bacterium]|nr:nucleoside monophosphate kinase [Candidatus Liptonbacteria bacterium]
MNRGYDAIFVLGPQGSGKGTQAKLLAEKLGFFFWDTGAVLRRNSEMITVSGARAGDILKSGRLFTDEELLSVVRTELESLPREQGIVFDGIPRRVGQADFLFGLLQSFGKKRFASVFLDIPIEESRKRLLLRAEKEGRSDDTLAAIERRLADYQANTVPMLPFMRQRTEFFEVDGRPSIEAVQKSVNIVLELA